MYLGGRLGLSLSVYLILSISKPACLPCLSSPSVGLLNNYYSVFGKSSMSGSVLPAVCLPVCLSVDASPPVSVFGESVKACQVQVSSTLVESGPRCLHAALPRIWIRKPLQQILSHHAQAMELKPQNASLMAIHSTTPASDLASLSTKIK